MSYEFQVVEDVEDVERLLVISVPDPARTADSPRPVRGKSALERYRRIGVALAVTDALCVATALLAAHSLRFGSLPSREYLFGIAVAVVLWVGVFHALGLYAPYDFTRFEEFRRTISAVGIGLVAIILLTFWFEVYLSRSWMAMTLLIALTLEVAARTIARAAVESLRTHRSLVLRTLVVGNEEHATELMDALDASGSGFLPLGCIDTTSHLLTPDTKTTAEQTAALRLVFREYQADCVFVASPGVSNRHMGMLMRAARQEGVVLRVFTYLPGILTSRVTVKPIARKGVALTLKPTRLSASQRVVKRGMDLVLAGSGLILLSPVLLVVAVAIRVSSRGPVLFRQERVTDGSRPFRIFKFRTMTNEPDRFVEEQTIDTSVPYFKIKDDPRLTKVGGWLRKWSIDELPQLFNVVIGDMSLVGPRPLPANQVAANLELLGPRLEVRAGITGWWQIHGRADVDLAGALAKDDFYIENWSPTLDVYILARTMGAVVTRRGAY
jgi:exopolysaccharide biosynthesis polyprenyl glycosylphosphotransferase